LPKDIQRKVKEIKVEESIAVLTYPEEELHLTIKFLGDITPHEIGKIKENLRKIKFKSFRLNLDKIGFFPKKETYVKVVWVGLNPKRKVCRLKEEIDDILVWKFNREKGFEPHITIGRVKAIKDKDKFRLFFNKKLDGSFNVTCFRLMKSEFKDRNVVHSVLEEYP